MTHSRYTWAFPREFAYVLKLQGLSPDQLADCMRSGSLAPSLVRFRVLPDAFADEISLIGPPGRIKERLELWRQSPVTSLLVGGRDPQSLRQIIDLAQD